MTAKFNFAIAKRDLMPIVAGTLVISKKFKTREAAERAFARNPDFVEYGYKVVELDEYKVNGIVAIPKIKEV